MGYQLLVKATLATEFDYELLKKMDVDPEQYEVHQRHPAGVVSVMKENCSFAEAVDYFFKHIKRDIAQAVEVAMNRVELTDLDLIELSTFLDQLDATGHEAYVLQFNERLEELSRDTGLPIPDIKKRVKEYRERR